MKSNETVPKDDVKNVAPPVGAWIEIVLISFASMPSTVAPPVGAWIEIKTADFIHNDIRRSLPPWERGLKLMVV